MSVGYLLLEGIGLEQDLVRARHWSERAAAAGITGAMTRLGTIHNDALGTPRDPEKAVSWWRRAADPDGVS